MLEFIWSGTGKAVRPVVVLNPPAGAILLGHED
jgi:hypothetical protein